ncbi:MAG TPA: right-handed parallel beta-helix repeat-containing protein [bacterium]|jgi:hypothetical protein
MKRLSILGAMIAAAFMIMTQAALGDTYVAGQVSGIWTLAGSPYMVVADIEIPYPLTLTIQAGVTVKFAGNYKFIAHGTLTAIGAAGDSILFTHHLPYPNYIWKGLFFEGTTGVSELGYCIFEWGYAQGAVGQAGAKGGAVHALNTTVNIHDCRFSDNKADAKGAAIYYNTANGEIYNCNIASNACYGDGGGIYMDYAPNPYIHDNVIKNNTADNGGGLYYAFSGGVLEENNIHHNSATSSNGGGLLLDHSSPTIQKNVINYNTSSGSNGTGVYLNHYCNPLLLYNEICWNNYAAIYAGDNCSPQIENNTLFGNGSYAIRTYLNSNPFGRNNIITGNTNAFYISSGCSVYMTYSDIQGGWTGVGNINLQPYFVNVYNGDFNLMPNSPCIDAGSPLSPLDPDGTIADMGAHYFDQNQPQGTCTITLTPFGAPIILPPQGGVVWYGLAIQNSPNSFNIFDCWINMQQPDGQIIPILLRNNIYLPAGAGLARTLSLRLNATAMAGTYTITGYVGDHPITIEDFDSFTFVKSPASDAENGEGGTVMVSGWGETETVSLKSSLPQATRLLGHFPEPCNPTAAISFELRDAADVRLEVYSLAGQKVATILNRYLLPGVYRETFDGSGLSSGMYLYRLQAGSYAASGKMVLMK